MLSIVVYLFYLLHFAKVSSDQCLSDQFSSGTVVKGYFVLGNHFT